jgi:ERCC4-type nuclease
VGLDSPPSLRARKPKDPDLVVRFVAAGIPGIGEGRAESLLSRFGSLGAVFSATERELASTPGVGKGTARAIRRVMEHRGTA